MNFLVHVFKCKVIKMSVSWLGKVLEEVRPRGGNVCCFLDHFLIMGGTSDK